MSEQKDLYNVYVQIQRDKQASTYRCSLLAEEREGPAVSPPDTSLSPSK